MQNPRNCQRTLVFEDVAVALLRDLLVFGFYENHLVLQRLLNVQHVLDHGLCGTSHRVSSSTATNRLSFRRGCALTA